MICIALIVVDFACNILRNFLYWYSGVRVNRSYDVRLAENCWTAFSDKMVSSRSIVAYFLIAILSLAVYKTVEDLLMLIITICTPFVLLITYNLSSSYRQVCKKDELDQMKPFIYADAITAILSAPLSILA